MVTRVFLDESLTPTGTGYNSRTSATFNTQVGDILVVCAGLYSTSAPTATHNDGGANSALTGLTTGFSDRFASRIFYKLITTARTGDSVTVTTGNVSDLNIAFAVKVIIYRPGAGGTLSFASSHLAANTSNGYYGIADPTVSSSFSTTSSGVVVSFLSTDFAYGGSATLTIPSGYTSVGTQYYDSWQAEYFNSSALSGSTVSWSSTDSPYYRRTIVGIAINEASATPTTYEFNSFSRGVGRGIARGIA